MSQSPCNLIFSEVAGLLLIVEAYRKAWQISLNQFRKNLFSECLENQNFLNPPNKFFMYPFLNHCSIHINLNSKKWRK